MPKKSNSTSKKAVSTLYHYAEKYIDLKHLFRDGKPKISDLTDYKIKKIKSAIKHVTALAGSKFYLERDFVKIKRTTRLRKYNTAVNTPKWVGGVIIRGGVKHNQKIHITKNLELSYIKGVYDVLSAPLDAISEKTLIASIEKHRKRIEREKATYIGTNGNYIFPSYSEGRSPTDKIIEKSLFLFSKYNAMAENSEVRYGVDNRTGKKYSKGVAQKMDRWNYSLLWERKIT